MKEKTESSGECVINTPSGQLRKSKFKSEQAAKDKLEMYQRMSISPKDWTSYKCESCKSWHIGKPL